MWGSIVTDINNNPNFNIQFPNTKSDVLIHLIQWQYWWWFWFSSLWVLYYLFLAKTLRTRVLKFKPRITSSFRPHGKWGDLIICLIPASWCFNILVNSNFLLKLLEWQAESSLFTIRIRGKQWYWVYKFDLKNIIEILSVPKNIGRNKWVYHFCGDIKVANNYLHLMQMRSQEKWQKNYWNLTNKFVDERRSNLNLITEKNKINLVPNTPKNIFLKYKEVKNNIYYYKKIKFFNMLDKKPFKKLLKLNTLNIFSQVYSNFEETNRNIKNSYNIKLPISLVKLNKKNLNNLFLIKFRYKDNNSIYDPKVSAASSYLCFKQKRYKRRNVITPISINYKNYYKNKVNFCGSINLKNNYNIQSTSYKNISEKCVDLTRYHRLIRKSRVRNDKMNVFTSKRLLRVKKTLVLPTHINITAITNSYDVVHSWFIPGLGIKMDCVPGRSTHHTFYIDNAGFYYGQCAEICGRYHHHMPIRVCALPFEHFLLWWNNFGLPKLTNIKKKNLSKEYSFRKFNW